MMGLLAWAAVLLGVGVQLPADLDGRSIAPLLRKGDPAVVLFFAASDCPISNRYVPEMQRLAKEFAGRDVRVWFVYPNPGDTAAVVRAHDAEYGLADTSAALDPAQSLVKMARATVTPEVAVFVPGGMENGTGGGMENGTGLRAVFVGRVDDRYVAFGRERPRALHHDLEDALRAVLAGKPVPQAGGPAVGCSIVTTH